MSDTDSILSPGVILGERYELTEEIGRGGFGMVYRARQMNMDRDVAIKILPPKFMAIPDVVERFRREARLASRLRHPNTITVHDYGKQENLLFIVMELLEGEDLADLLMRKPILSLERILHVGRQVLKSLNEAHSHNIIHRDLKPENIFLTQLGHEEDYVKVLDFGIAKLAMPEVHGDSGKQFRKLTMSGSTVGTPTYMSPEQAAGEEVDARTDLYALGVILYEMACGRPPFKDDNPVKVMRSHLFEEIPRFPKGPLRGSRFETVILKALNKDKAKRFESANDFLKALAGAPADLLEGQSFDDEPPTVELTEPAPDNFDSEDIAYEQTASYQVEGSDEHGPRSPHNTEGAVAAQGAKDSVPFTSVPDRSNRDRVHEGAVGSGLTDASGLTSTSSLNSRAPTPGDSGPPPGLEHDPGGSSIITVLEPGPEEDVILLTKKKGDTPAPSPSVSEEVEPQPRVDAEAPAAEEELVEVAQESQLDGFAGKPENGGDEWSWGAQDDNLDLDGAPTSGAGSTKLWTTIILLLVAAAAAAGYLHYSGQLALF